MEAQTGAQKNKLKLLYLLAILRQETDEEHPLPATELCSRLEALGISCERKSIYRDIEALSAFGYEVISTRKPRQGFFSGFPGVGTTGGSATAGCCRHGAIYYGEKDRGVDRKALCFFK